MRMLIEVKIPNDGFNPSVRDGSAGEKIQRILEATNQTRCTSPNTGGAAAP